jgi:hypothetical protein
MNKQRRGPDNTLLPQPDKPRPIDQLTEDTGEVNSSPKEELAEGD